MILELRMIISHKVCSVPDRMVDSWLMMSSPWPIAVTVTAYLYFVLHLGPKLMENRKPFDLKWLLIVYNFYNVVLSSYLVWQVCLLQYSPVVSISQPALVTSSQGSIAHCTLQQGLKEP